MEESNNPSASVLPSGQRPAIRFLVESALRRVISGKTRSQPRNRQEWVTYLVEALMSESDAPYQSVLSSLMANGVSSEEIYQRYVPDAARLLGELWVSDEASFVDVTVGAARLQQLFRNREDYSSGDWLSRSIPLGHSVLMIVPKFEEHSLGAFVAADELRRHGLWVHMGIGMEGKELVELIRANKFSMIGITLALPEAAENVTKLVDFIRENVDHVPPVVMGGNSVLLEKDLVTKVGADHGATSAKEAIDLCGLPSVSQSLGFNEVC